MDIKITKPEVKEVVAQGHINKDGNIGHSQFADVSNFLQKLHSKTCANIPESNIVLEKGLTKHHVKINDVDYKSDSEASAKLLSVIGLINQMTIADKVSDLLPKYQQTPDAFTLDILYEDIANNIGVTDCIGSIAHNVIDEL
jgi:hypothetical protein